MAGSAREGRSLALSWKGLGKYLISLVPLIAIAEDVPSLSETAGWPIAAMSKP